MWAREAGLGVCGRGAAKKVAAGGIVGPTKDDPEKCGGSRIESRLVGSAFLQL